MRLAISLTSWRGCVTSSTVPSKSTAWSLPSSCFDSINTSPRGLFINSPILRVLTKLLTQTLSPSHINHTGTTCGCIVLGLVVARRARTGSASTDSIKSFLSPLITSAIGILRLIYKLEYITKSCLIQHPQNHESRVSD